VISKRRQEQEFLRTRVLVEAALAPHLEGGGKVSETFKDYANAMFPFLQGEKKKTVAMQKEALENWVSKGAMAVKPLWRSQEGAKGWRSKLRKGAEAIKKREDQRSANQRRHRG
jgi:hypothetical protein